MILDEITMENRHKASIFINLKEEKKNWTITLSWNSTSVLFGQGKNQIFTYFVGSPQTSRQVFKPETPLISYFQKILNEIQRFQFNLWRRRSLSFQNRCVCCLSRVEKPEFCQLEASTQKRYSHDVQKLAHKVTNYIIRFMYLGLKYKGSRSSTIFMTRKNLYQ